MTDTPENIQDGERPAEAAPEGVAPAAAGRPRRRRRAWHAVLWTLASVTVLLLAAPWLLYIPAVQTYVKDKDDPFANVGRNDPCPCGSGKKYKHCHGKGE